MRREFGIASDVFSVTSFSELAREAAEVEREARLTEGGATRKSHVETLVGGQEPVIAATDYVRGVPAQIAPYLDTRMTILGTDGFGRSANRGALRRFFEVDAQHIALAAIQASVRAGGADAALLSEAAKTLGVDAAPIPPWQA